MGYSETTQAYKMYLPGFEKKVLWTNVRFEEARALRESLEQELLIWGSIECALGLKF